MQLFAVKIILALIGCLVLISCGDSTSNSVGPAKSNVTRPVKLGLCAGCHGETGKAVLADYPNLNGQNQRYLANSLRAYKTGERKNSAMRAMVGTLTDAEIEELASYYANSGANE
jgi:cytochrome c553